MAVKRVILIRPGETDWNRIGRWQGWAAAPLSEHGRQQALALASFVRNIGMSALYTSDLKRAVETAECLAEQLSDAPIKDARLRERNIGDWQGLTLGEMRSWYAEEYAKLLEDPNGYPVPGGESRNDVRKRMRAAFDEIVRKQQGETVGILSHTTALKTLLEDLLPGYNPQELNLDNTSVTTIRQTEGGWELVAADDITHLEGLETKAVPELEDKP
jgi:broad specificity phosphatase PhoE